MTDDTRSGRGKAWLGPATSAGVIGTAVAAMLAFSWLKWPDVHFDFGIQVYTPWRVSQGAVLYRDVATLYGPLSSYVHAAVFKAFGPSLHLLFGLNLLLFVVLLFLLHKIMIHVADRTAATTGCLLVVLICGFSQYTRSANYNFMAPYSHEATHGFLLAVTALYAWMRFIEQGRERWLAAAGACTGLAALTKPEMSLAAAGLGALALPLAAWRGASAKAALRRSAIFAGSGLMPLGLSALLFCLAVPPQEAVRYTLAAWVNSANPQLHTLHVYAEWMGIASPGENVRDLLAISGLYACVIGLGAGLSLWLSGRGAAGWRMSGVIGGTLVAMGIAGALWRSNPWLEIAAFMPATLVALLVLSGWRCWRGCGREKADMVRLLLVWLAILMLMRIGLRPRMEHFGFVLAVAGLMVITALLVCWGPRALEKRKAGAGKLFLGAMLVLLGVAAISQLRLAAGIYKYKPYPIIGAFPGDRFYSDYTAPAFNALVNTLNRETTAEETIAVFPENCIINYLARRRTPTRYVQFMPSEVAAYGEENILRGLAEHPAGVVVLVQRDTSEYGPRYFGRDYAKEIGAWIRENYTAVDGPIGATPFNEEGAFGILILGRNAHSIKPPRTP